MTAIIILFVWLFIVQNVTLGFRTHRHSRSLNRTYFIPQSPCPTVFRYVNDENEILIGAIRVEKVDQREKVQLEVELSVIDSVEDSSAKIILAEDGERVINNINNGKPIYYRVLLPTWQSFVPRVTNILINGNQICSGQRLPIPVLKAITLQHQLSLNSPPLISTSDPIQANNSHFLDTRTTESSAVVIPQTSRPPSRIGDSNFKEICGRPSEIKLLNSKGQFVPREGYPWLVAIFRRQNVSLSYICTGSLISDRHVVTAAHCMILENSRVRPSEIVCAFGKLNIRTWTTSTDAERMLEPKTIVVHPDYETGTSNADLAVLTFQDPIPFHNMIKPVCLWQGPNDLNLVVGNIGIVVGWGGTYAQPKQVAMPIVDHIDCLKGSSRNVGHALLNVVSKNTFCAGFRDGTSPCDGTSGSAFLLRKYNIFYLRGIVSGGIVDETTSCSLEEYIVFTDVSKYVDWLTNIVKQN